MKENFTEKNIQKLLNETRILNGEEMKSIMSYCLNTLNFEWAIKCMEKYYYSICNRAEIDFLWFANAIEDIVNKLIAEENEKYEYHSLVSAPWGQVNPAYFILYDKKQKMIKLSKSDVSEIIERKINKKEKNDEK